MTTCQYCGEDVEDMADHYAVDPPAGCQAVAVAFGEYWPFKETDDAATEQRRAAGRANAVKRGGKQVPLPVVNGVKMCRCGQGPVVGAAKCRTCRDKQNRSYRARANPNYQPRR